MNNFYQWKAKTIFSGQMSLKFFDTNNFQTIGLGSFSYNNATGALEHFSANFTITNQVWSWHWDNQGGGNAIIYLRHPTWNFEDGQPQFAKRHQDGQANKWEFFITHGYERQQKYLELILYGSRVKNGGLVGFREEKWLSKDYASNCERLSA